MFESRTGILWTRSSTAPGSRLTVSSRARHQADRNSGISENGRIGKAMDGAINISLPESLLAEILSAAKAEHRSVDEVLTDAAKRYVEDRSWTKLLDYGAERAKALGVKECEVDRL